MFPSPPANALATFVGRAFASLVRFARHPALLVRTFVMLAALPLALHAQLAITSQPQPISVLRGQSATFSVTANASGYQWRRNGYAIPGATQSTLTLTAVSQGDADNYDVVVTSGGSSLTSETARLWVTLPAYPGALEVDSTRSLRLEGPDNGELTAQAALPDGRFYFAGNFKTVGGQPSHDIVRFNANGTVDSTFTSPTFDSAPKSLALQLDGKIVVGGFFKTVDGVPTGGIVRLNSDGSRDNTFAVGTGFSNGVQEVFVTPGGSIYVYGGGFGSYQGSGRYDYIAKLTSNGLIDSSFRQPTFFIGGSTVNPLGLAVGPTGLLYVRGGFDQVNGETRVRLARLLPDGSVDPAFNPGAGPNNYIHAMVALSNGQLAIAGDFTAYGGTSVGHIARLNANGTLDTTFATGTGFSNQVNFLAELPGNQLLAGAVASTFNGTFVPGAIRLTATGARDTTFAYSLNSRPDMLSVLPGGRLLVSGVLIDVIGRPAVRVLEANGSVSAFAPPALRFAGRTRMLAHLPGGRILVAGDFSHVNNVAAPYVMRLNADLTRDTTFPAGAGPNAQVLTGVVQPDGKILLVTMNGMIRLNANGSNDTTFTSLAPGGGWYPVPPVILRDGRIFVVTTTPTWGGSTVTNGLVILEANGTRATSHAYLPGPPAGSSLSGAQLLPNGQLLVVGSFNSWNGVSCNKAVRLNTDGSVDSTFVLDSAFAASTYMPRLVRVGPSFQRDGRIVAMNDQGTIGMARFNANGSRDSSYPGLLPSLFDAGRMIMQPDDRVIVAAQSQPNFSVEGLPNVFVRLTRDGTVDPTFSIRGSGMWQEAIVADNGELLSSDSSGFLHRYAALPLPIISAHPVSQTVVAGTNVTLSVTASSADVSGYQWLKNGVPLVGATNAALTLDAVSTSAAGAYSVVVTNAAGSVTSNVATLVVTTRPPAGVYFGTLGGTAGTFALLLRADGTGVLTGFIRSSRTVLFSRAVQVGTDRSVRFTATAIAANGTETSYPFEAVLSPDGALSGNLLGLNLAIAASPPNATGSTSALAGFYQGGAAGSGATSYVIVGSSGAAYAVTVGTTTNDAGQGTADATGQFSIITENNTRVSGSIQTGTGLWTGQLLQATGPSLALSGANNDARSNIEKLTNISARSQVGGPLGTFTAGFVVTGDLPKPVLVRAIGPTLAAFQVSGALPAARLEVFGGSTSLAVSNDWGAAANAAAIAATAARVGAFALPAGSRDAALLLTLAPGNYSATVSGQGGATGVALVEVYDATEGVIPRGQRIINLSTLAFAGTGSNALAAGFFVTGTVPKRVLIRGVGPGLAQFGLNGVLARPQVAVFSGGTSLAVNAGWNSTADGPAIARAAAEVGAFAFPAGSQDAALIVNLSPGSYSAEVSGVGGATGIALVEIYELP